MDTILRMAEITPRLKVTKYTIWRLIKAGEFPKPIKLGKRAVGWRESDLNRWLEERQG